MKHTSGDMGFWEPGARIYTEALANAAAEQLAELTHRLNATASPAEREMIEQQMAAVRADFDQKCNDASYSLF